MVFAIRRWLIPKACLGALALLALSARADQARLGAFGPGEQITYDVSYLGITAGSTQITVGSPTQQWGQEVWPIIILARTYPAVFFYVMRDKFVTYWDAVHHRTLGNELLQDENHKRRKQRVRLDHDKHRAIIYKQKDTGAETEESMEIPVGTSDIAAATFALRNQALDVGQELELPVFTGSKTFVLKVRVEGREKLKTALGEKDVLRLRAKTQFSGKLQANRDIVVYFSLDPSHVPLRLEADFALGKIVANLTEYKSGRVVANAGIGGS